MHEPCDDEVRHKTRSREEQGGKGCHLLQELLVGSAFVGSDRLALLEGSYDFLSLRNPSPVADVGSVSPVPVQMWQR